MLSDTNIIHNMQNNPVYDEWYRGTRAWWMHFGWYSLVCRLIGDGVGGAKQDPIRYYNSSAHKHTRILMYIIIVYKYVCVCRENTITTIVFGSIVFRNVVVVIVVAGFVFPDRPAAINLDALHIIRVYARAYILTSHPQSRYCELYTPRTPDARVNTIY